MKEIKEITRDNCRLLLAAFMEQNEIPVREVAKAIGCSQATLTRILAGVTKPTDEMMKQVGLLIELGFPKYKALSKTQRKQLSEGIGAAVGGTIGFGTISSVIGSLGISGVSAAGITSGLATLGSIVGGGMLAGVTITASIPLAFGALGYGVLKGVRYFLTEQQLNKKEIDPRWEIPVENNDSNNPSLEK